MNNKLVFQMKFFGKHSDGIIFYGQNIEVCILFDLADGTDRCGFQRSRQCCCMIFVPAVYLGNMKSVLPQRLAQLKCHITGAQQHNTVIRNTGFFLHGTVKRLEPNFARGYLFAS